MNAVSLENKTILVTGEDCFPKYTKQFLTRYCYTNENF